MALEEEDYAFLGQKRALWRFFTAVEGYFERVLDFASRRMLPERHSIRLLDYQIAQAQSQIGKIQQAYENDSLLYTPEEAAKRIDEYRDKILKATQRKEEIENSLQRIVRDSESMEQIKMALTKVHMENVRNATFEDRERILNILDVKVYPSENLDAIVVTCAVNLAGLENSEKGFSCYNTSIASPKL